MRGVLLHREDPLSWSLMPEVGDRIAAMADEIGSDFPGHVLVESLWQHFVLPKPKVAALAALADSGLIGHALIETAIWGGKTVCNIRQIRVDEAVSPADYDPPFQLIQAWAIENGCEELRALALNERLARLFRMRYDFGPRGVMVGRPVVLSPSAPKETPEEARRRRTIGESAAAIPS